MSVCCCKECGVIFDLPDDLVDDYCPDCWEKFFYFDLENELNHRDIV